MKHTPFRVLTCLLAFAGVTATEAIPDPNAQVTVQSSANVVGTGTNAWSYLILEGEDYDAKQSEDPAAGFTRVGSNGTVTSALGNPVLGADTTASKKGALFTQTVFGQHIDKVTYQVQFARAGTYYLYMRFTMFENGGNPAQYLNEDSFFVPPDWEKDPQTDWPLSDRGGYAEGCCDGGFLTIKEDGVPVSHSAGEAEGQAFWEGKFHWNELLSSQFLDPETQGEPRMRFKYEVPESLVGKPLNWTISYREGGVTIDLFLFSTNPNLMDEYSQEQLDQVLLSPAAPPAAVTVQDPGNVVGTGTNAWSYLILEGEDYDSKLNEDPAAGFTRVDNSGSVTNFLGNPVLGADTTASKQGALFTQTVFGQHIDKVTYQVQFARAGTYYLYMRFTMFENGGTLTHYLNEDSFFVPPDWEKDPQTDWPLSDRGGYAEGCCDGGFLTIKEDGVPVSHSAGEAEGQAFWEGKFHWNELISSQFLDPETQGEPRMRFKYEVPESLVGKPLNWTISYREGGVTIDLFLFSTNPNLMDEYSQNELDSILLGATTPPSVTVQDPGNVVGTGTNSWSYLILEGEDYDSKVNEDPAAGFTRVDNSGSVTNFLGNPVLGADTTASKKGALFTQTVFGQHIDKVTYQVQFARAGTYYLYMRFTMFENGGTLTHYLNEDSFFVPPDWEKDPQTDWPLSDRGGYAEGCCDGGFLTILEDGVPVSHSAGEAEGQAFWEGKFHWNELLSSQFLDPETQGEPRMRFKYEVPESLVGKPLNWTISYREGGVTIDLFLFSTNPNLMSEYSQAELDQLLLNQSTPSGQTLSFSVAGKNITLSWPSEPTGFVLESSPSLSPATWTAVPNGNQSPVTIDASSGTRFYRLNKP